VTATRRIRVLVVNGDTLLRQGLSRLLGTHPAVEVVGWALSGRTALPKIAAYAPDVVVLDLEHNQAEGLELLDRLGDGTGVHSLVVAPAGPADEVMQRVKGHLGTLALPRPAGVQGDALVAKMVHEVLPPLLRLGHAALGTDRSPTHGRALATFGAPVARSGSTALEARSAAVAAPLQAQVPGAAGAVVPPAPAPRLSPMARTPVVVGIGVSTGGPKALTQVLPALPADFPVPILVVQHMPPKFTQSLAESLDKVCALRVGEARDGERVERGRILIAPGGQHMKLVVTEQGPVVRLTDDPPECSCRPSVDYLFRSLAEGHGGRVLGVVLTGMGEDGWLGSRAIHAAGGRVLAQDEASSTVYGMPRGPVEAGVATAVGLQAMAEAMVQVVRGVPCN